MTTIQLLDLLREAYEGDPWHGPSLQTILRRVTPQTALARPLPGRHSIFEIVLHITGWTREVKRRLGGAPAREPEEGDWPAAPAVATDAAWTAALVQLDASHRALVAAVQQSPDARWADMIGDLRDPELGSGVTCGTMIVGLATHYAYHGGQIALLAPR